MQTVISAEQAKRITGGRTPLVPVEYEAACRALTECVEVDEAKYWSDKADALAAWAKIYRNDEAGRKAAMLKLHAFRRMGEIAEELAPLRRIGGGAGKIKTEGGPTKFLTQHLSSRGKALAASRLASIPPEEFAVIVNAPRPPGLYAASMLGVGKSVSPNARIKPPSDSWRLFGGAQVSSVGGCAAKFRAFCRHTKAQQLARGMTSDEAAKAREIAREITEWLDEFEQHLPK